MKSHQLRSYSFIYCLTDLFRFNHRTNKNQNTINTATKLINSNTESLKLSRNEINELTVNGFTRIENRKWKLMISCDIIKVIVDIVNSIHIEGQFKHYNEEKFKLSENKTIITPINRHWDYYNLWYIHHQMDLQEKFINGLLNILPGFFFVDQLELHQI